MAPGIQLAIGPPIRPIASYKSVKVSWNNEKFLLELNGVVEDVIEGLKVIDTSFNKFSYPLKKICHYYEITFDPQPVDIDNFVTKLRSKVNLEFPFNGEILKPFSISFSNVDEPITRECFYRWLHIRMDPDANAPQKRVIIQIIKRDTDFNTVLKFIEELDTLISNIINYFME